MRVGILGGSFNPVHIGHVRLALEAREQLGLDRVEVVTAGRPPHKSGEGMLPFDLRLKLLSAGLSSDGRLAVNDLEGRRSTPSYTYDTLTEFRCTLPEAELHFIIGARDFLALPTWRRGLELIDLAHLAVADRGDEGIDAVRGFMLHHYPQSEESRGTWILPPIGESRIARKVIFFTVPRLDVSSSLIRDRWRSGRSLDCLIPHGTLQVMGEAEGEIERHWGKRGG